MGMISLPIMLKYGYDMRIGTGVIAASGTITQVIPPSLVLIILADQLGVSVGDMYLGAIGPSVLQIGALPAVHPGAVAILQPHKVPALPPEARTLRGWPLISKVLWGMIPSLVLIFLVLGTIFLGLATPTEAGAMGAVGAIVLAMLHGRFSNKMLWQAMTLDHADHRDGGLHPDRRDGLQPGVPGRQRRPLDRAHALRPAGRRGRVPDLRQWSSSSSSPSSSTSSRSCFIVVPMLVPVGARARHQPGLVRAAALREHADLVHASALRLRALLPARASRRRR